MCCAVPNMKPPATCMGTWSTDDAEKMLRVPIERNITPLNNCGPRLCAFGLPKYAESAPRPWRSITPMSPRSTSSHASCHDTSTCTPLRFTIGLRRRSGSSCSCFSVLPFGQMNPWLKTSSLSPRMRTICSCGFTEISKPQVASQSGQVRKTVRFWSLVIPSLCHERAPLRTLGA